jgi:hypothetical protein
LASQDPTSFASAIFQCVAPSNTFCAFWNHLSHPNAPVKCHHPQTQHHLQHPLNFHQEETEVAALDLVVTAAEVAHSHSVHPLAPAFPPLTPPLRLLNPKLDSLPMLQAQPLFFGNLKPQALHSNHSLTTSSAPSSNSCVIAHDSASAQHPQIFNNAWIEFNSPHLHFLCAFACVWVSINVNGRTKFWGVAASCVFTSTSVDGSFLFRFFLFFDLIEPFVKKLNNPKLRATLLQVSFYCINFIFFSLSLSLSPLISVQIFSNS